ncbi:MAG TPA: CRISPR-associated helicase Cas3' [Spirochaetota bacterium]|jgi:CRISPR-associated endonuclease/helicase Cas3|nr:CRISPR-associated helicase Cas3' [Spirochaetota bacterium]
MADNSSIWAKSDGIYLKDHTGDILKAFDRISEKVRDNNLKRCITWAIILHDIGKALPYFQIRVLGNKDYRPWDVNKDFNIYHSLASLLFINEDKLKEKVGEDNLKYVLSAIAYHHWKDSLERDLRFGYEKFQKLNSLDSKTKESLVINIRNELGGLIRSSEDLIGMNYKMLTGLANGLSVAEYAIPPYQMYWLTKRLGIDEEKKYEWIILSGFLQRCDHFVSFCEHDNISKPEDIEIASIKREEILQKIKTKINIKSNIWQEEIISKIQSEQDIYQDNLILIAPTGSGKTEFGFLWSLGEKVFYTLPARAAAEQIYDRATAIFGRDRVGLLHSDADVYLSGDDYDYEKIKVYETAKQLSYPVIVSTGDQFFPYGLRPPGYERIYATFSYSRLVIDEIQAYDPRAAAIIVKFIEDIYRLGGKFLLMTATLPEYVKNEIEERIKNNNKKSFNEINLYELDKGKYQKLKKHKLSFIEISNKKEGNNIDFTIPDNIIEDIVYKANNGNRVLVILNTVENTKNVYNKIKSYIENENKKKNTSQINIQDDNIILFHSQFTLNEKNEIKDKICGKNDKNGNEIKGKFHNPKEKNENEGKILVATQVVEAAIDIDADILYTEICPMDALVQRMGRVLRRYKENFELENQNEKEKTNPNVYVLVFQNGYESGNGKVYDNELIENTLLFLDNPNYEKPDQMIESQLQTTDEESEEDETNARAKKKKKRKKEKEHLKLENLNDENYTLLLSEYQKFELVNKLYKSLSPDGKYLSKFYETLSLLDAGFMSDRKEEAQRLFREIMNAGVVDIARKEDFKKKIKDICESDDLSYTRFKKDIIADFVIQIPYHNIEKLRIGRVVDWIEEVDYNNNQEQYEKRKKKIKDWCDDLYVVNLNRNNKNSEKSRRNSGAFL